MPSMLTKQKVWMDTLPSAPSAAHMHNMAPLESVAIKGAFASHTFRGLGRLEIPASGNYRSEGIAQKERQEFLWQDYFLDPAQWWDNRLEKRSSRHPDFRRKRSKEALWLDNLFKPAWVDSQLAILDAQLKVELCVPAFTPASRTDAGPCRVAGCEVDLEVVTWRKLCREGQLTEAVDALDRLVQGGHTVERAVSDVVLKRCIAEKDLALGRRVYALILKRGNEADAFLANQMIRMYASLGSLEEAMQVFTKVPAPDAFLWCAIISVHADHGQPTQAMMLYRSMRKCSIQPNSYVFVAVLKACTTAGDLRFGKEVHADILECGVDPNVFVGSCLVDMYSKCGSLKDAHRVFENLSTKTVVTWNAMIGGYAQHDFGQEALALYERMQQEGTTQADRVTYICLLKACTSIRALQLGKQVHAQIQQRGLDNEIVVGNCLVDMYAKCGSLVDARRVFDRLPKRNVVTWTAMIAGYAHHGTGQEALALHACMQQEGMTPADNVTFVCLLQACAAVGDLIEGKQLHAQIQKQGLDTDVAVGNCLVHMYAKCGNLADACSVFDRLLSKDVVTWNAMIGGHVQVGLGQEALTLYARMQHEGISPTDRTFVCLLNACTSTGALSKGEELHFQIQERGLEANLIIGNSLVDMYAKCGSLQDARKLFDRLPTTDVVTWTALISGYVQEGLGQEAIALYRSMRQQGINPTDHTFVSLLKACGIIGALREGKELHSDIQERGLLQNSVIGNSLVDMYAKCGQLEDARKVFETLPAKDVVTWTTLLNGYAIHSDGQKAIECFKEMQQQQDVEPNGATFSCLLVACSHNGLVAEGRMYFKMMVDDHGIAPTVQHYTCMVDLLARSGHLDEAENMLQIMPFDDAVVGWTSLLYACKTYGDVERGRRCFDHLVELEPDNASAYVLLASIYANAGCWPDVDRIENLRKSAGANKKAAKACIEVQNKVHEFIVGYKEGDMSSKSRSMNSRLREEGGHVPHTELVLKEVPKSEKENALCGHAEKLALAYGLLNTPDGTTLLVTKNLRMCNDCHSSTKIMSSLEKREIIVRDAHRVHRFMDGCCSCGDRH